MALSIRAHTPVALNEGARASARMPIAAMTGRGVRHTASQGALASSSPATWRTARLSGMLHSETTQHPMAGPSFRLPTLLAFQHPHDATLSACCFHPSPPTTTPPPPALPSSLPRLSPPPGLPSPTPKITPRAAAGDAASSPSASDGANMGAILTAVGIACCGAFAFGYHLGVVNGPLEAIANELGFAGNKALQGLVRFLSGHQTCCYRFGSPLFECCRRGLVRVCPG